MTANDAVPAARSGTDPWRRVSGRTEFTSDVPSKQSLYAAFALSAEPYARLKSVDVTRAAAVPGVSAVLTGGDIGQRRFGRSLRDYPVLAVDRVLFTGQRIAAVAAWDMETARAAAELVDVDYEPLDPVLDPQHALAGDAPVLHPAYAEYDGAHAERAAPNIQGAEHVVDGDIAASLRECDEVHDHTFSWPRTHSAPLEPHGCLVAAGDPEVHVYSAHKEPYNLRRDLALISGRPEEHFVIHPISIGGDFGAKGSPFVEGACYFLSVATGRPVRTVMSYFEELTSTSARHPGRMRLRTGLRDGHIQANEAETLFDGGAFAAVKPRPTLVQPVMGIPLNPYQPANRDERSTGVYTNSLPGGQVRSPGEFQATFAGESHVDMIARARGEDPLQFRLNNVVVPEAKQVLEELQSVVGTWRSEHHPDAGGNGGTSPPGIGVAIFHRASGAGRTTVSCEANATGIHLSVGAPDQGAGSYIAFQRLAAQILSIPERFVAVRGAGADPALIDSGAGSSRVTAVAGRACAEACRALLREVGDPPVDPAADDGYWIGSRLENLGRPSVKTTGDWIVTRGEPQRTAPAHGGMAIELTVDTETGVLRLQRAALIVDAGPVVNPVGHRGQLEGGFVYGLGQTLFEELVVEDGQVVTASLGDYKLASAADVPPLDIRLLPPLLDENEDPLDAIRAVGELANLGVPPAIANAIDDAVGVRIQSLPITAEKVWQGLHGR